MKNIEKYTNTRDALEAYNSLCLKNAPFDIWLQCEYEEPRVPTLLELAKEVVKAWYAKLPEGSFSRAGQSIVRLSSAIEREKRKHVRNCDKYKTAEEAYQAFIEFCGKYKCINCRFGCRVKPAGCAIAWLYDNAIEESEEER